MSLSLAQRGGSRLTYYLVPSPHRELYLDTGAVEIERRAEADGYPLIMAVRAYCVWGKVVIEMGQVLGSESRSD